MATGLEALGTASAVIQLISFSTSVISKAIDVYQGRPLPDSSVEEYAEELQNAVSRVELCCQGVIIQQSARERKIVEIAEKCQKSARKLHDEVRSLSSTRQSGRARNAFSSAMIAMYRQNKLRDLEGTLRKQKEVLEAHLLAYICTQTQAVALAQKKEFQTLSDHIKRLVAQIAAGNTNLESRVQAEHGETRALLVKEVKDTGGQVTSEIATAGQRTRFLDSLKSYSMNQRYNDITDPEEATYQRIFAAYDRACDDMSEPIGTEMDSLSSDHFLGSIEKGLDQLASWLQASDSLFWISGKPGSGKSTFMKTIVNSSSVKMLLERWDPRAEIISHFFWKIGSKPQNSVKGLLCTLSYQILLRHEDLLTSIPNFQYLVLSRSSYHDWSLREVKSLLLHLLNSSDKYFCIFIDGLDEINEKEGPEAILSIVSKLAEQQRVKVCVSSRPEHQLEVELTALHAPNIKMEWFTAYDMRLYVEKELEQLRRSGIIRPTEYNRIVSGLIGKASGVFLWLCLATRSVKDGAKNGDFFPELFARLEQLPGQLEDLYTDMWNRLNHNMSLYKDMAASIFRCMSEAQELPSGPFRMYNNLAKYFSCDFPTIVSIGYAVDRDFARQFAQSAADPVALDPLPLCKRMEEMIRIRSVGLLEVERSEVSLNEYLQSDWKLENALWAANFERRIRFIHRTAYDFFATTEAGKAILKHSKSTVVDLQIKMLESWVCLAQLISTRGQRFVDGVPLVIQIYEVVKQYDPDLTKKVQYEKRLSTILARIENAYSYGYANSGDIHPFYDKYSCILGQIVQWELFDDFTASLAGNAASPTAIECVWRKVWNRNFPPTEDVLMSSIRLIKKTLPFASASNWHHDDVSSNWKYTPFTSFLAEGLALITWIDAVSRFGNNPISETALSAFLDLLLNVASNVMDWDGHVAITSQLFPAKGTFLAIPCLSIYRIYTALCQASEDESVPKDPIPGWVFYHQVSLRFLFQKVVRDLTPKVSIPPSLTGQLHDILQECQDSSPWAVRLVKLENTKNAECYEIVSQARFDAFNRLLFTRSPHTDLVPVQLEEQIFSLTRDCTATKVISVSLNYQ